MAIQRSLVLIKPDAVQRGAVGEIIARFERKGLTLVGMKLIQADRALAERHYVDHKDKPFFSSLIAFITGGPLVAVALEGEEAIAVVRNLMGATDGRKAAPGTIRGDYSSSVCANLVHGSDSEESAAKELEIWFGSEQQLAAWTRCDQAWLDVD